MLLSLLVQITRYAGGPKHGQNRRDDQVGDNEIAPTDEEVERNDEQDGNKPSNQRAEYCDSSQFEVHIYSYFL